MGELNISTFLKERVNSFSVSPVSYHLGTVTKVGDGVVRVKNLPGRQYGELLEFDDGVYGMALDLEQDGVGAVLFDIADSVKVGSIVRGTGVVAETPVGECMIGRVVDPIGRPLDGKSLTSKLYYPAERRAPHIIERSPVNRPMQTGILAIDSMVPIGRGQRELIIGDRQTGKTSIAIDSIINQKNSDMFCIYCAIGQKASSVALITESLRAAGAMEYTTVVSSTAADSPAMQYLAPYCACSIAEYFMEQGKDVLVVYDDLSKHAVAYRTMSLLLHRPPGREAYPGDVFYLHSRLLERSAQLCAEKGGGSITALPIVETMAGNISAYIPTNIISITDGQIYLEDDLFKSGFRPAVNTGLSVSRVGRSAQHGAMKSVSGTLRIDMSQYREMAVFARFGSDVDASTKLLLKRGECLMELLKQNKAMPYSLFNETALLLAYSQNAFVDVPGTEISAFAAKMLVFLNAKYGALADEINMSGKLSDDCKASLTAAIKEFGDENRQ